MSENLKVLNITPEEILQTFLAAYYDEYEETCRIGSSEYSYSTVVSYALSVLLNQFNDAFKQRYIDYATGTFLDALAATYGIMERPQGYKATCVCRMDVWGQSDYAKGSVRVTDGNGHVFENAKSFSYDSHGTRHYIPFVAVENGSEYNGIPVGKIREFDGSHSGLSNPWNTTQTGGGVDADYFEDDDHFRTWLQNEIASFAGAGTAQAYRGRAMNADSRMIDAYVVQQGDDIFENGKVKIYILAEDVGAVYYLVEAACKDPAFRPVCDYVEIYDATPINLTMPQTLVVTYESRFRPLVVERNSRILEEYRQYLRAKIGRSWVYAEIVERFKATDDDGIYASDAVFVGVSSQNAPIYPDTGHVHNLTDMSVTVRYVDPH